MIMEAMEGIGQGVYLRRIQDKIAEYGVCCVYDRLGFGYSSDAEAGHAWDDRSPKNIARQLMYALTSGTDDTPLKMPVSFEKPFLGTKGENLTEHIRVAPPYVLLAHSAAALYARQFAHDYPKLVAGMVLIDPLPAVIFITSKNQLSIEPEFPSVLASEAKLDFLSLSRVKFMVGVCGHFLEFPVRLV